MGRGRSTASPRSLATSAVLLVLLSAAHPALGVRLADHAGQAGLEARAEGLPSGCARAAVSAAGSAQALVEVGARIPTLRPRRRRTRSAGLPPCLLSKDLPCGRGPSRKRKRSEVVSNRTVVPAVPPAPPMSWHCAKQLGKVLRSFWAEASVVTLPYPECQAHMDRLWELDDLRCPLGECLDDGVFEVLLTRAWPFDQNSFMDIFLDQWTHRVILGTPLITDDGKTVDMSALGEEALSQENRSFLMEHFSIPRVHGPEGADEDAEKAAEERPTWKFARHLVMDALLERLFGIVVGGFDKKEKWAMPELKDLLEDEVSFTLFEDPVVGIDGRTYERSTIRQCIHYFGEAPMTRREMQQRDLVDDLAVRTLMRTLSEAAPQALAA